ncbi:MAG: Mur ligase domain-containing protein, partial [Desulfoprunum sp.]|nr:Mur ligase domain-containing protein [Desulfoprunum sp.]
MHTEKEYPEACRDKSPAPLPGHFGRPLVNLLAGISYRIVGSKADSSEDLPEISAISTDSRQILNGSLFVAISGSRQDGHSFID